MWPADGAETGTGRGCTVVIDTLRATTSIAAAFSAGVSWLAAVDDEEHGRALARDTGAWLAGEVGGLPPPGFDMGNSPVDISGRCGQGDAVVLYTTNGTRALCTATGEAVFAGALVNAAAVAKAASAYETVDIVCAGNVGGKEFSLEDFATAAVVARYVTCPDWRDYSANDGARLAEALFRDASDQAMLAEAERMIAGSDHARRVRALGLEADIAYACRANTISCVPQVTRRDPGTATLGLATA